MLDNIIGFHPSLISILLRVAMGFISIRNGARFLKQKNNPVQILELLCGACMLSGFMTRVSALILAGITIMMFLSKPNEVRLSEKNPDLIVLTLVVLAALVLIGGGRFSIDYFLLTR